MRCISLDLVKGHSLCRFTNTTVHRVRTGVYSNILFYGSKWKPIKRNILTSCINTSTRKYKYNQISGTTYFHFFLAIKYTLEWLNDIWQWIYLPLLERCHYSFKQILILLALTLSSPDTHYIGFIMNYLHKTLQIYN